MRVEVVAFAALRDALGAPRVAFELPAGATAGDLRERMAAAHPRWRDLIRACRVARGTEFVEDASPLGEGEVVLIPSVSGGSGDARVGGSEVAASVPAVRLVLGLLIAGELRDAAAGAASGAVVVFEGTVRSPSEGKDVLYLEYEAYEAMARAQMERIVAEARRECRLHAAFLHHRLGRIEVGETSVVAVAASAHRADAFAGCRQLIERLKADVPIWKREVFADGSVWVGAPKAC